MTPLDSYPDAAVELEQWMKASEDEHLEFKEAKGAYNFETLVKYCCALANEKGGKIILGVTDRKPRNVVGSSAFKNLPRTKAGLTLAAVIWGSWKGGKNSCLIGEIKKVILPFFANYRWRTAKLPRNTMG